MRISFEVSPPTKDHDGVQVEIYLDSDGRDYLVRELTGLTFPANEHFHMLSPEWGSNELTEERRNPSSLIGRHVKVYLRPDGEDLWTELTNSAARTLK
jgi:hypothetical protein